MWVGPLLESAMLTALSREHDLWIVLPKAWCQQAAVIYTPEPHTACRHQLHRNIENGWTALRWFPCTHHVSLKGLQCMYSSDTREELNHSWASLPPLYGQASQWLSPSNLWREGTEECWSGQRGWFTREERKLILLVKDSQDPSGTESIFLNCFLLTLKSKHIHLLNVNILWSQRLSRAPPTYWESEKQSKNKHF